MKLNNIPESKIKDYLDGMGYHRKYKKGKRTEVISESSLNKIFKDEFYYGKYIRGDDIIDLRELTECYKPIITEEQFQLLQDRGQYKTNASKVIDKYKEIRIFPTDFIVTEDGYGLTFNLPNANRFKKKNAKGIILGESVASHQIKYTCKQKKSEYYNFNCSQKDIDKHILKMVSDITVTEEHYNKYKDFMNMELSEISRKIKQEQSSIQLEISRVKKERDKYIERNYSPNHDKDEKRIYKKTRENYQKRIDSLSKRIEEKNNEERNKIVELEVFIDILSDLKTYYANASYVRKGKISEILFSNITLDRKKSLQIKIKPGIKDLFNPIWSHLTSW